MIKIGLEIHAQLLADCKLFSGRVGTVSPLDLAHPGHLPLLNQQCVRNALKTSLLLGCQVNKVSIFDRKHYFYPDLPLGYQITQYYHPLAVMGKYLGVSIDRVQLEQDTAKMSKNGGVDYRRAGRGLIEIVTGAEELSDAPQTEDFCRQLSALLKRHKISSGNLQDGSLRVDVNISLHEKERTLVPRVEVKNIMGFRFISKAIEAMRRIQEDSATGKCDIPKGTWMFDQKSESVRYIREKTIKEDYQYFPDPELEPLLISDEEIQSVKDEISQLSEPIDPEVKAVTEEFGKDKRIMEWYRSNCHKKHSLSESDLVLLLQDLQNEMISSHQAKMRLSNNMNVESDSMSIDEVISLAIKEYKDNVEKYKQTRSQRYLGPLVGFCIKKHSSLDPNLILNKLITQL